MNLFAEERFEINIFLENKNRLFQSLSKKPLDFNKKYSAGLPKLHSTFLEKHFGESFC